MNIGCHASVDGTNMRDSKAKLQESVQVVVGTPIWCRTLITMRRLIHTTPASLHLAAKIFLTVAMLNLHDLLRVVTHCWLWPECPFAYVLLFELYNSALFWSVIGNQYLTTRCNLSGYPPHPVKPRKSSDCHLCQVPKTTCEGGILSVFLPLYVSDRKCFLG